MREPPSEPAEKAQGAFLALAAGDALGWPQEGWRADVAPREPRLEFREWTRRSGGRFRAFEERIRSGEYSDDTQLMLAVARCRAEHGNDWWRALTEWELPFWTLYARGGGGATKRAARSWMAGVPPWESRKLEQFHRYFGAGGNGVAMRVLPHALFLAGRDDPAELIADTIRDGIATHGHPRALVGAAAYAFAAWWLSRRDSTLRFGELLDVLLDEGATWSAFPAAALAENGSSGWLAAACRAVGGPYERMWDRTVQETRALLATAADGVGRGALADDPAVLRELGCFGQSRGAGTISVAAATYLVARHAAQPQQALLRAAFESGADTDTLAAMAGGLAGCLAGLNWLPPAWLGVQDASYLRTMASRVAAGPSRARRTPVHRYCAKDTKNQMSALVRNGDGPVRLGPLKIDVTPLPNPKPIVKSITVRAWLLRTAEGQTMYLNKIERASDRERDAAAAAPGPGVSQSSLTKEGSAPRSTVVAPRDPLYAEFYRQWRRLLGPGPKRLKELEEALDLVPSQLKRWLDRAEREGRVRRTSKRPAKFALSEPSPVRSGTRSGSSATIGRG
jgi:ADP-ribosylglycohydrolase